MVKTPFIYLAIPTGAPKFYAIHRMIADIRNLDYPQDRLYVSFAVTDRGRSEDEAFYQCVCALMEHAHWKGPWQVLRVTASEEEMERWGQYYAVITNLHTMRKQFLDGDWEYFWVLGGDNPPKRDTLKRLLALDVDVGSAIINQRPMRGALLMGRDDVYPVFWKYVFTPKDVRPRLDLHPLVREAILQAWVQLAFMELVKGEQNTVYHNVCFGSGCSLVKRRVLEYCGYYLGAGYHSEDIHFAHHASLYGFDTAVDTRTHCPHFDPNGSIY